MGNFPAHLTPSGRRLPLGVSRRQMPWTAGSQWSLLTAEPEQWRREDGDPYSHPSDAQPRAAEDTEKDS